MSEIENILNITCKVTGCSLPKLRTPIRTVRYATCRFLFFGICKERGYREYVIMELLQRHRTSGIYYRTKFADLMQFDKSFRKLYDQIITRYEKEQQLL